MDKMFAQVKITAQNTIKRVLDVTVASQIGSCDCINGSVSISGKISATMVYLNAENKIETATKTSLNETTVYQSNDVREMIDLMNRMARK